MGSSFCRHGTMNEPTIPKIKKAVAKGFKVSIKDINSRTRRQPIALARQVVFYYARKLLPLTYYHMADAFNRDYSNFVHAIRNVENLRSYDFETKAMLEGIEDEFPWLKGEEVEA